MISGGIEKLYFIRLNSLNIRGEIYGTQEKKLDIDTFFWIMLKCWKVALGLWTIKNTSKYKNQDFNTPWFLASGKKIGSLPVTESVHNQGTNPVQAFCVLLF